MSQMPQGEKVPKYVIGTENPAEMARLMHQDRLYTKYLNLFPQELDPEKLVAKRILDIACGPGGWTLDVAMKYPFAQVDGIDISSRMIQYAQAQAEVQIVPNIHFSVMDVTDKLSFPDNTFSIVNARLITGFMSKESWPRLLAECFRITQPGGYICLTECEIGFTNGENSEKWSHLLSLALYQKGQTFSPNGHHFGIVPVLRSLIQKAGYQNCTSEARHFEYSASTEAHEPFYQNNISLFKLIQPFLKDAGVATQDELDIMYNQSAREMLSEDFCGVFFFLRAWGQKPDHKPGSRQTSGTTPVSS